MVILLLCPHEPANQYGRLFWYKHLFFCIPGTGSLLPLPPVLPAPGLIMPASILGDIQVLCGSCAGSHSAGRGAALWQRALLHLRVLCVIPSAGSLLYSSLLVQVSHSFLPSTHLLDQLQNWHLDTLNLHRFCGDFRQNNSTARSLPAFSFAKKLFNKTNIGVCSQALEVPWEHPSSKDGDGGQSHTYIAGFQLCYSVVKVSE